MKINSSTFYDFVKNATVTWRKGYQRVPLMAKRLYEVINNEFATSEHSALDGFTFARRKNESDNYYVENPTQNYSKILTKYRIGLEAVITWEMRKYDRYREMNKVLSGMGEATAQRMELDLTHRFTFASDTSYVDMDGETVSTVVGDGFQLAYTAHIVPSSSRTYRNIVANNPLFSKGGLEAAETLFAQQMIDAAGNKVIVRPDTIVIADDPNTENTVLEYLRSTAAPDGGNSGVENVYKSKYSYIKLPYLATDNLGALDATKAKRWFLAAVAHTDAVCEVSENPHMVAPSMGSNSEDFDNDDWKFKTSAAYSIEIIDPKWIVMSAGNGTA